ncbi:MAG TPA: ATP-binding protein [Nocardioidaceae bacterium]|nr:ATP-binding protein [Nocardioidaceae bacterium]
MPQETFTVPRTETEVAVVWGRSRLPSDIGAELIELLATEPEMVVCDLTGMAALPQVVDVFAPVASYLSAWPGTVVAACVPDPAARDRLRTHPATSQVVVTATMDEAMTAARRSIRPVQRAHLRMLPLPASAHHARAFAADTLHSWNLSTMASTVQLVVSELVTNAILHAHTVVDLSLSRIGQRVRVGVHDRAGGRPTVQSVDPFAYPLGGQGLLLAQEHADCWGVLRTQTVGKTVWAVLTR